ncbi:hypothetical protein [Ottowia sp.]|uniref:hypothetical protein n=1 Tax=Ottowia sp. TaxID=1898956 RepID=UPI003A89253A
MSQRVSPALLAAIAVMALALAGLWLAPSSLATWRQWQAPPTQAPNLDDVQAAALVANPAAVAAYPVVLERPLMSPARRPQAAASAASAAVAVPTTAIEQMKLRGLIDGPALNGVLVEEGAKGEQARFVKLGEQVGDWTLQSIQGRKATFARRGQTKDIELPQLSGDQEQGAAQPAAPAPPARPTAPARPANPPARAQPPAPPAVTASAPVQRPATVASPSASAPGQGGFGGGGFGGGRRPAVAASQATR